MEKISDAKIVKKCIEKGNKNKGGKAGREERREGGRGGGGRGTGIGNHESHRFQ